MHSWREKSRGKSENNSSDEGNNKRRKIDKDEREKEINDMSEILKNIEEQIEFKQLHLKRHKSLQGIINLQNEKKITEKQLKWMEMKDAKSRQKERQKEKRQQAWRKQTKRRDKNTRHCTIVEEKQWMLPPAKSAGLSDSNEALPDTITLSPDELDDERTINSPSKLSLDDANQSPAFVDHSDSEEAENQSQELFSQQVNKEALGGKQICLNSKHIQRLRMLLESIFSLRAKIVMIMAIKKTK